jgi:hypothetical protein
VLDDLAVFPVRAHRPGGPQGAELLVAVGELADEPGQAAVTRKPAGGAAQVGNDSTPRR